jgi:hypothetical protein
VIIKNLYFQGEKRLPPGHDPANLPLAKIFYYTGEGKTGPVIVRYSELRLRFPRDINNFLMGKTKLVPFVFGESTYYGHKTFK